MAKYTKVRFLKYFNRPIVFVAIEIDTILVALALFWSSIFILSFSSFVGSFLIAIISFLVTFVGAFYYNKKKDNASNGFLKHMLYILHIYRVNIKKFPEEVKRMDVEPDSSGYYPDKTDKLFIE